MIMIVISDSDGDNNNTNINTHNPINDNHTINTTTNDSTM